MQTDSSQAPVKWGFFVNLACEMVQKSVGKLSTKLSSSRFALHYEIKESQHIKVLKGNHYSFFFQI